MNQNKIQLYNLLEIVDLKLILSAFEKISMSSNFIIM